MAQVAAGPWLVQKAVGSRPAIVGKTLRERFFDGEVGGFPYFEVDIDCNSSPAAGRVVQLVKIYASALVVDLGFVIEAQTADELEVCASHICPHFLPHSLSGLLSLTFYDLRWPSMTFHGRARQERVLGAGRVMHVELDEKALAQWGERAAEAL